MTVISILLVVWLFPVVSGWILATMIDGVVQPLNPLKWDIELRIPFAIWTVIGILCIAITMFINLMGLTQ